ncbi:MAG TPA: CCA tRNA nucleotidyltransferase [Candidatus Angelobacter sp.]|jgi:tRNA nucleotidyltransferase/poly(A) polymerase|nr:CCA tRNA nucleotidyltransferase [Candidatus Angelobacter sp.]
MADFIYLMETRLSPDQQRAVALVTDVARAHEMNVYLTGGAVRDIISGFIIRDLDFSVQGNALKLQKDFEKAGAVTEGSDEHTRTIMLLLPGNVRAEVTSTRSEKYDKPGKPPEITQGTIYDDMRRRDFTVNAMALSLNPGSRGLLTDPFNGVADIELKVLRILHNYAFYEEPSRLIRATRLATRFHWTLEERTQARYDAAKENNYIENVNDRALGHEVEQLAHEDQPVDVLKALEKEGWLKVLAPHLSLSKVDASALTQVFKFKQQLQDVGLNPDVSPIVMYYLTRKLPEKDVKDVQKQIPNKGFVDRWRRLDDEAKDFAKRLMAKELNQPSATWKFLMQSRPEILLFTAMTVRSSAVETKIKNFLTKWPLLRQKLPFPEMAEMRITPELPEYRKIMDEAFLLLMDGKLRTHNEIVKFLTPYSPPEPPPPPPPPRRGRAKKESPAPATATAPAGQAAATAVAAGPKKRGRKPKNAAETVPAPVAAPAPSKAAAAAAAKPGPGPVKAPEAKPAPKPAAKSAPAKPGPAKPKPARAAGKPPAKKSAAKPAKKAPAKKSKKK